MKKVILNSLLSLLLVTGIVSVPYIKDFVNKNNDSSVETSIVDSTQIRITNVKRTNDSSYGTTEFTYSVNPNNTNAKILYKLEYSDGSDVENDILLVTHYAGSCMFVVKCNKVFTKQINMILYPLNQENVTAIVKFDFRERLSVDSSLVQNEGTYLDVNTVVSTTGGSITVDKSVKNETVSWNDDFVQYITNKLKSMDGQYSNQPDWYNDNNCSIMTGTNKLVGLTDSDLNKWFTSHVFSTNDFVNSIYYEVEYWYEVDDDISIGSTTIPEGYETEHYYEKYYINDLNSLYFNECFNGSTNIIDYTCVVDEKTYSESFGLILSQIPVSSVVTTITQFIF